MGFWCFSCQNGSCSRAGHPLPFFSFSWCSWLSMKDGVTMMIKVVSAVGAIIHHFCISSASEIDNSIQTQKPNRLHPIPQMSFRSLLFEAIDVRSFMSTFSNSLGCLSTPMDAVTSLSFESRRYSRSQPDLDSRYRLNRHLLSHQITAPRSPTTIMGRRRSS